MWTSCSFSSRREKWIAAFVSQIFNFTFTLSVLYSSLSTSCEALCHERNVCMNSLEEEEEKVRGKKDEEQ